MSLVRCLVFFLIAAAASVRPATAETDREVTRVFPVQPGCTLKLDTYRGVVAIEESDASEIRIAVQTMAEAETEAAAQRLCDGVRMEFAEKDNTVSIRVTNPRETGVRLDLNEGERVNFSFRISVPRRCDVDLRVADGNATIGSLAGRMAVRMKTGPIFLRQIDGAVDLRTDFGDILVSRCSGAVRRACCVA